MITTECAQWHTWNEWQIRSLLLDDNNATTTTTKWLITNKMSSYCNTCDSTRAQILSKPIPPDQPEQYPTTDVCAHENHSRMLSYSNASSNWDSLSKCENTLESGSRTLPSNFVLIVIVSISCKTSLILLIGWIKNLVASSIRSENMGYNNHLFFFFFVI